MMSVRGFVTVVGLALGVLSSGAFAQSPADLSAEPSTTLQIEPIADPAPQPIADAALPAPLSGTVSDFASVLDPVAKGRIVSMLMAVRAETGVHMVVVTMPTIDGYGGKGKRLDAYAKSLFNAWGIGGVARNDGIMMLVATDQQEVRIALGAGYDAVYDGRAARVLATAVLPEFREGRLAEGIQAGITASREHLITPFLAGQPVTVTDGFADERSPLGTLIGGLGAFVVGTIFLIWRAVRSRKRCPQCGKPALIRTREVTVPATLMSAGSGIEHQKCTNCGYVGRTQYRIKPSQTFGSTRVNATTTSYNSSGGFGGGRSSGGGASGRW